MLRLTPFTYLHPQSVPEALAMFQAHESQVTWMGGGTDLLPNIKHRLIEPKFIVGLGHIAEMREFGVDADGWLHLGGAVKLSELTSSVLIADRYPALVQAAEFISTPQVRRMGTIGGNICLDVRCNYYNQSEHWRRAIGYCMKKDSEICRVAPGSDRCWAVSSADTLPVLIALDAHIHIAGTAGDRWEPIVGFFRDDGLIPTTLAHGEIVTEIKIPPTSLRIIYSKLRIRMSFDFPLVGVATGVSFWPDGTVASARIVLTAVGSHPIQVTEAETLLEGNRLSEEVIRAAGEQVFRVARPMDNTEGSILHRKRMARVYVERSLRQLSGADSRETVVA